MEVKNKKLIIIIISVLVVILATLLIIFRINKIISNRTNIKHIETSFNKEYNIKEEKIDNKNSFNYESTIYSNDETKQLTCVNVILYDENNNVLLSYNENINMYVSKDGGYPISIGNDKVIDVASIKYELCE